MTNSEYSDVTPQIHALAQKMTHNSVIDTDLYSKYNVKRGLRDLDGKGVLTGLSNISTITQNKLVDGKLVPCEGELRYRGYNVKDIVDGILEDDRFGFEEVTYLLLFGDMPNEEQLKDFKKLLVQYRTLPQHFVRDVILKATSNDMMNSIARSVLTLFCYDKNANDTSIDNVLRQCIQLISVFPLLSVYGYHAYNHYQRDNSLYIHRAEPTMSTAEVILSLLRPDRHYTPLEAKILDLALVLHMEHGGGNNSTFTTHVVSSSGTDTYSAIAAALGSLKGPKHGGANIKVVSMFDDMKKHVHDWKDEEEVSAYLRKLLHKEAFDKMKASAVLLNLGRGPIVNDADLTEALEQGKIAAAGLDVLGKEPIEKDNPLLRIKDSTKLVITPHVAWGTVEARTRLMDEVYENIAAFTKGEARNAVV